MKRVSLVLLVGFFCLSVVTMVFSDEGSARNTSLKNLSGKEEGTYIVRFRKSPISTQGLGHTGTVAALQHVCHENMKSIKSSVKNLKASPLWIINGCVVQGTPQEMEALQCHDNVAEIVPSTYEIWISPMDRAVPVAPNAGEVQWSIGAVKAPEVWKQHNIDGSGIVVGHLDTGVDGEHPALKGKILKFKDFTPADDGEGSEKLRAEGVAFDDQGHGTHTAGSIAGGDGIGVAPGARLIVGKIFDKSGGATTDGLLRAMQWVMDPDGNPATNDGPRLVSNSWGSNSTTNRVFWDAVQAWVDAGILPVFAAGNSGPYGKVGTPGGFPHSWAVGATSKTDSLAYFSSQGPSTWDGTVYVKPDISGPGADVVSAAIGGGLVSNSGTSMACPHVAGLAALMFQANPALTIGQVRSIAEATSIDLGVEGKDNKFGAGRMDALACVSKILVDPAFSLAGTLDAFEEILETESALIGVGAETPLSGPLARSIILRGLSLDEGEFRSVYGQVANNPRSSAIGLMREMRQARRHSALHQ